MTVSINYPSQLPESSPFPVLPLLYHPLQETHRTSILRITYTSGTSQTFDASYTSHTPHTSQTSHTSYTHHTSQTSHTPHTHHTSTHHITVRTPSPTTPAFAVATFPCFLDNELGALKNIPEDAKLFCPLYLGYHSPILLPTYVSQFGRSQITSACSCFDAGDDAAGSTAPAVRSEADLVLISGASSSSTIV